MDENQSTAGAQAISVLGVCLGATVSYRRALDVEKD